MELDISEYIIIPWGDKFYLIPSKTYNDRLLVVLPTGKVLEIVSWHEAHPPVPMEIAERDDMEIENIPPEEIARSIRGILAQEISIGIEEIQIESSDSGDADN